MKTFNLRLYFLFFLNVCLVFDLMAQNIQGGWEGQITEADGAIHRFVVIFTDGYQVATRYDAKTGEFVSTNGGTWKLEGNTMTETVEFDTANPDRVGEEVVFDVIIKDNSIQIVDSRIIIKRIDDGTLGQLNGAWLMSGRVRDGELQSRDTSRPRKTMKILSGTRFQWIAYNTETKEFMGTGGGTYTTVGDTYTENIEFFSRDNTRVGASLEFTFELKDGNWHHTGFSSKGDPLHEIWTMRK